MTTTIKPHLDVPATAYLYWENRMGVRDIISDFHIPYDSPIKVLAIYEEIVAYSKENNVSPRRTNWELIDNLLFANGSCIAIIPGVNPTGFSLPPQGGFLTLTRFLPAMDRSPYSLLHDALRAVFGLPAGLLPALPVRLPVGLLIP